MRTVKIISQTTFSISFLCFITASASADTLSNNTSITNSLTQAQSMQLSAENTLKANQTQKIEDHWSEWGLTREDWLQYKKLKEGPIGTWTPNLDPLTTLGIEAKTDTERKRYAELLARIEYARAEKILAFQMAYDQAFARLYPNQLPFRTDDSGSVALTPAAMNRIIYFTRIDCGKKCSDNLVRLFDFAKSYPIDIYVVDSHKKDEAIRKWALDNKIDTQKVRTRQITLNHDQGYWLKYANGKIPAAFQIQGDGEWKPLAY
ncbi:TIGR03759 family integrating conjugative element protein [Actinobacillus pleuropneumoniae]|uniref:TIGR03759 family integrating conjugative element protein n=1 Tax=Actinobacillus pleuropneumoniae TaxID=715 RepID=UPI003B0116DC